MNKLNNIVKNLLASFNANPNDGWSGRKLTVFYCMILAGFIVVFRLPDEAQLHAFYALLATSLLCLGILTVDQIIRFKNGSTTTTTETKVEAEQTITETKVA
jgi:hypothetical protein